MATIEKIKTQINECATIEQLVEVVNKVKPRKKKDYIKFYLPFILIFLLVYIGLILLIVFGINKYIYSLIATVTIIVILCGWGIFDKYLSLKIFKKIRQFELDHIDE